MNVDTRKKSIIFDEAIVGCGSEVLTETDIILPENCPDILKVLQIDSVVCIKEKETGGGKVILRGEIEFTLFYTPDPQESDYPVKSFTSKAGFTDICEAADVTSDMKIRSIADVTSISHSIINSRKLNVKAVVHTEIKAMRKTETEFISDADGDVHIETLKNDVESFCQYTDDEFEIIISDKLEFPSGKPFAAEILKVSATVSEYDIKLLAGKCIIKGTCSVNTLYISHDDMTLEFMEHEIPFTEVFETPNADENMTADADFNIVGIYHESDGDENGIHTLGVEIKLLVDIDISGEQTTTILSDCYSPDCEITVSRKLCKIDRMEKLVHPQISIKGELSLSETCPDIFRVCNITSKPFVDRVVHEENRIILEGHLKLCTFYITSDLDTPVYSFCDSIPFTHSVNVDSCTDFIVDCSIHCQTCSYTLSDDRAIGIRATADASVKIICNDTISVIEDISVSETTKKDLSPIVIYFVQPNDTMWSVAKKYKTTIEKITKSNNISATHTLSPGTRLVIPTT